jgi:hypothetical protein
MGLNDIVLPASSLTELYKNSLVDFSKTSQPTEVQEPKLVKTEKPAPGTLQSENWQVLGNNQKNILIITNKENEIHLNDKELEFLTGILSACRLTVADVAIINFRHFEDIRYKDILSHFNSNIVLLFGVDPETFGLPLKFPEFQLQSFDKTEFLYSPSLKLLENDKILKSKLWVCLKRIFKI